MKWVNKLNIKTKSIEIALVSLLMILNRLNITLNIKRDQKSLVRKKRYPFYATGLFLYPLTRSENLRFSNVFKRYIERDH